MNIVRGEPVPSAFCVSLGDDDWVRRYITRRYHAVDPRLRAVLRSTLPFRWNVKSLLGGATPGTRGGGVHGFVDALSEAGMRSGIMLALPGSHADERSIVSLSSHADDVCSGGDALIARAIMLAMCMHEFYSRYAHWPQSQAGPAPKLSARQEQILISLSRGLTDREISEALDLSMHGVDYHLRRLRQSFGARNRVELVQAAFRVRGS
jgi:DNA-binding CsgD family transcriptional regulator